MLSIKKGRNMYHFKCLWYDLAGVHADLPASEQTLTITPPKPWNINLQIFFSFSKEHFDWDNHWCSPCNWYSAMAAVISPKEEGNIKVICLWKNRSWEDGTSHQATEVYCRVMCEARSIPALRMAFTKRWLEWKQWLHHQVKYLKWYRK